ncbi:MAG TPA: ABC transporter permease subunit [Longimicrobiales bacterium]|nr:ABC transporter permease subunit [Longimicrobiales bacterium]
MNRTVKVVRYEVQNVLRSKALVAYGLFFFGTTLGLIRLGGGVERALPSLANVVLLAVPLVSLLITTVFLYDGRAFTELLLSHPVARPTLFGGLYLGLALPLSAMFVLGVGVPMALFGGFGEGAASALLVVGAGALLTAVFTALGFWVAFSVGEAARGLAAALILWLAFTLVYDGVVLIASHTLAAYPLERPMLAAMVLNPVDLARVMILMAVDASALLGYTGAVFQDFFGGGWGVLTAGASLVAWVAVPYALALRRFRRMDF